MAWNGPSMHINSMNAVLAYSIEEVHFSTSINLQQRAWLEKNVIWPHQLECCKMLEDIMFAGSDLSGEPQSPAP